MANLANPQAMRSYLTGNLGYSPTQAAALLGNIQQESGFDPNNYNKGEGAYGLVQWRGDRLTGLQNYAASRGTSPSDWQTQLQYIKQEMGGPEAKNSTGFMAAQTLPDANTALKSYIRYGDNSQGARLNYATSFLGDTQPQMASLTPNYGSFGKPELVPGDVAPALPPPTNIDGQTPGILAGNTPTPTNAAPGGMLGNPMQLASMGMGAMNGQGLLGGMLGGEMPKAPPPYIGAPVHPRVDMSPLMQFLARASAPSSWSS